MNMRYKHAAILGVSMFIMVTLLVAAASQKSFWEDETFTMTVVHCDLHTIITADSAAHPPLYYLVAAAWSRLVDGGELALRLPSIVFAAVTLALGYGLSLSLLGQRTATLFALLMSIAPLWLVYGANARYYAMTAAVAMAAAYCTYNLSTFSSQFMADPLCAWWYRITLHSLYVLHNFGRLFAVVVHWVAQTE